MLLFPGQFVSKDVWNKLLWVFKRGPSLLASKTTKKLVPIANVHDLTSIKPEIVFESGILC